MISAASATLPHIASLVLWAAALLLLAPPAYRLARRRPRYLDALWTVCLIGVCNRLALATFAMPAWLVDTASATLAALFVAVVWSYQRADR